MAGFSDSTDSASRSGANASTKAIWSCTAPWNASIRSSGFDLGSSGCGNDGRSANFCANRSAAARTSPTVFSFPMARPSSLAVGAGVQVHDLAQRQAREGGDGGGPGHVAGEVAEVLLELGAQVADDLLVGGVLVRRAAHVVDDGE